MAKKKLTQEQKDLRKFHETSSRHVLVLESDLTDMNKIKPILDEADRVRKAGNELVGVMRKHYHQLIRTKKYKGLLKAYGNAKDESEQKVIAYRKRIK